MIVSKRKRQDQPLSTGGGGDDFEVAPFHENRVGRQEENHSSHEYHSRFTLGLLLYYVLGW